MSRVVSLVALVMLLGTGPRQAPVPGGPGRVPGPVLRRTFPLVGVRGPADRSGIPDRMDHMAYDPATARLFLACVANGSLQAVDLDAGKRVGTVSGLPEPQGVGVVGRFVFVTTGGDGKLRRFDARTLAAGASVAIGDDADNVRVGRDGKLWVGFGGEGPGGLSCLDPESLTVERTLKLPRMPEGFQLHPTGAALFANLPAGKRSTKDGAVIALKRPGGEVLWERPLSGRAANFPMALDPAHDRIFVATRTPARLISLDARDGSILGEAPCPPQSDDLFFDARTGRVAVIGGGTLPNAGDPGGAGAALDLFAIDEAGRPSRLVGVPLPPHTRTGLLVADRRCVYVAVPGTKDRPAEIREYRLPD